jgi:hypothetical protein
VRMSKVQSMTTEELVDLFVHIAIDQDTAMRRDETATYNRLFDQMTAIKDELKGRPGDQRRLLLRLYDHPNMQVQLKSAIATLAIDPQAARHKLQMIADSRRSPQAGDAGMTLAHLERGIFKPT